MNEYVLAAIIFFAAYAINMIYISVFYHRGFTHEGVKLPKWVQKFVVLTGNWVTGLDVKGWACMHRLHHQYSDTPLDPHSPVHYGIWGLLYAQLQSYKKVLWGLSRKNPRYTNVVADLDFEVNWLNRSRVWYLPYVLHGVVGLVIAFGFGSWLCGLGYFFGMMSHPIQGWMVNSFAHTSGYRNFKTSDRSTNNTVVTLLCFGEGLQNNHHRFPQSAKFSVKWFEIDLGWYFCQIFDKIGLVTVVKENLPKAQLKRAAAAASPVPIKSTQEALT